jgi:hypothetical protein
MKHIILAASLCASAALAHLAEAAPSPRRYQTTIAAIAAARRADPSAFQAVAAVRGRVPELDRHKRGRLAPVAPILRAIGPRALLPMLEALVATEQPPLTGTARVAWRVGLLEAIAVLRDPRATPVLRKVLVDEADPAVVRAAAAALGSLGDVESLEILGPLVTTAGPKQHAVIAGMAECRRLPAAKTLVGLLSQRPDEETARVLCKALGGLGSAWAWETPRLRALGEGNAVRGLAVQALLGAFVRYGGEVREAAETAIILCDAPQTLELISRARASAPDALRADLARLASRVEHSPLHPRAR